MSKSQQEKLELPPPAYEEISENSLLLGGETCSQPQATTPPQYSNHTNAINTYENHINNTYENYTNQPQFAMNPYTNQPLPAVVPPRTFYVNGIASSVYSYPVPLQVTLASTGTSIPIRIINGICHVSVLEPISTYCPRCLSVQKSQLEKQVTSCGILACLGLTFCIPSPLCCLPFCMGNPFTESAHLCERCHYKLAIVKP